MGLFPTSEVRSLVVPHLNSGLPYALVSLSLTGFLTLGGFGFHFDTPGIRIFPPGCNQGGK